MTPVLIRSMNSKHSLILSNHALEDLQYWTRENPRIAQSNHNGFRYRFAHPAHFLKNFEGKL